MWRWRSFAERAAETYYGRVRIIDAAALAAFAYAED